MAYSAILVLLSLNGTLDFWDMVVNSTALQTDGQDIMCDLFKFVVGMNLHDAKSPRIVNFKNKFEFVDDRTLGPTQRKSDSSVIDFSGNGVENGYAVDVVEIYAEGDVFQIGI